MFDAPVDAWYVWIGLALVGVAALGVASDLPEAPPPDATAAAAAIDRVAAADHDATGRYPLEADAVKLRPHEVSLRRDGRTSHARIAYAVTPVREGTRLWKVLRGEPPQRLFNASSSFERAAERARERPARWRRGDRLLIRTVIWGDVHVTIVGA